MPPATAPTVVRAAPEDRDRCIAALVAAFIEDPFVRWMFPDSSQYLVTFAQALRHFGGRAFDHASAYRIDDFAGAALWLPPGIAPDEEALGAVLEEGIGADRLKDAFAVLELMDGSHPQVEHWYLPAIGVDPVRQGLGFGSALLAQKLEEIDREGVAAYLESSNARNIPLYEKHGFEVVGEIRAGSSPAIWPMLRPARAGS